MNSTYQLQELNRELNEILRQLSCEVTDGLALEQQDEYKKRSWEYFIRYLDERLQRSQSLFTAATPQATIQSRPNSNGCRALGYKAVLAAARCINGWDSGSLTLHDLVDALSAEGILSDADPNLNFQVVFHIVGYLTGIWDPVWDRSSANEVLQIRSTRIEGKRRFDWTDQQAVQEMQKPVDALQTSPISYIMGGAFGQLLPRPERVQQRRQSPEMGSESISKTYFSWEAVSKSDYHVVWTSTLNEHLQIDKRHKRLSIYQHPSLCWLLYKRRVNLLSKLFSEEQKQRNEQEGRRPEEVLGIDDFFDDLLRSYPLIFASDSVPYLLRSRRPGLRLPQGNSDPLLHLLCSSNQNNATLAALRTDLEVSLVNGPYVDLDDYPFLGKRLNVLANIGKGNDNPNRLWKLWVERFNLNGYTYRWVMLFLVIGAFIFQIIQTIAGVLQVTPGMSRG